MSDNSGLEVEIGKNSRKSSTFSRLNRKSKANNVADHDKGGKFPENTTASIQEKETEEHKDEHENENQPQQDDDEDDDEKDEEREEGKVGEEDERNQEEDIRVEEDNEDGTERDKEIDVAEIASLQKMDLQQLDHEMRLERPHKELGIRISHSNMWHEARYSNQRVQQVTWGHNLSGVLGGGDVDDRRPKTAPAGNDNANSSIFTSLDSMPPANNTKNGRARTALPRKRTQTEEARIEKQRPESKEGHSSDRSNSGNNKNNHNNKSKKALPNNLSLLSSMSDGKVTHVEFIEGERLFYGCKVALQSVASMQFLMAGEDGKCDAIMSTAKSQAAAFTVINLENVGSNGIIRYGDAVWLQSVYTDVVGSRITNNNNQRNGKSGQDRVGMRVGRPVLKKLDRNLNLTAKWTLVNPSLDAQKSIRVQSDVGHLGVVCLEQDWYYLADDGVSSTSLRQGIYCPDGVMPSGVGKGVEKAAMWKIHLLQNGSHIRAVPRDELVLSTAQQQIKLVQERMRSAVKMTKSVRAAMRQYARDREATSIDALRSRAEGQARAVSSRITHLRAKQLKNNAYSSSVSKSPMTFAGLVMGTSSGAGIGNAGAATETAMPPDEYDILAEANAAKATNLTKARARAMAIAAESLVSAEVWIEIHQQEARLKLEESRMWNTAALAVQRAWKRWAKNRWERKLKRLDSECQTKVIWEIERAKEAAIAAAILSKVGGGTPDQHLNSNDIIDIITPGTDAYLLDSVGSYEKKDLSNNDNYNNHSVGNVSGSIGGERNFSSEIQVSPSPDTDSNIDSVINQQGSLESATVASTSSDVNHTQETITAAFSNEHSDNMNAINKESRENETPHSSWDAETLLDPLTMPQVNNINTSTKLLSSDSNPSVDNIYGGTLSTQRQLTLLHYINPAVFKTDDNIGWLPDQESGADVTQQPQQRPRQTNTRSLTALTRSSKGPLDHATGIHRVLLNDAKKFHGRYPDGYAVLPFSSFNKKQLNHSIGQQRNQTFEQSRPQSAPVGTSDAGLGDNFRRSRYFYLHTYDANGRALPIRRRGRQSVQNNVHSAHSNAGKGGVLKRYGQLRDRADEVAGGQVRLPPPTTTTTTTTTTRRSQHQHKQVRKKKKTKKLKQILPHNHSFDQRPQTAP